MNPILIFLIFLLIILWTGLITYFCCKTQRFVRPARVADKSANEFDDEIVVM